MKQQISLTLLFAGLVLSSCTIRNVTSDNPVQVGDPYRDVLVLFVEDLEDGFYQLDEASYDKFIRHRFNNVQNRAFRDKLSAAFMMEFAGTRIHQKKNLFQVQQDYSFEEFSCILEHHGIQSLLLVSSGDGRQLVTGIEGNVDTKRLRDYQSYLLDLDMNRLVWFQGAEIVSANSYNKLLARRIAKIAARDLRRKKIIIA